MATWDAEKLLVRMREVLESGAGTLRTIASGLMTDLPPGLTDEEQSRRGLVPLATGAGFPVSARIVSVKRSLSSPPVIGNIALYDIEAEVAMVYPIVTKVTLTTSMRDQAFGIAASHADKVAQALGYPGNLTQTTAGASTGLVSGLLSYVGSSYAWAGDAGKGGTLTARHRFKGIAQSAPAVS